MKLVRSAFECIYLTEIFPLYFGISLFYLGEFWYTRACLKKAFCKMCVTICGRFCPNEVAVAGYGNRIRAKSPAKWGVQIAGMIFQTHSNVTSIPHIFITHSYYRIKLILTTVSQDNLSISKRRKVILICIINLCYINVNPV